MAESQWRTRSRQVIARVMAMIPEGANLKQVKELLRDAYPFGERRYHPYKMWLSEQRKALARWQVKPEGLRLSGVRCGPAMRVGRGAVHLYVVCDWCQRRIPDGCVMCRSHHQAVTTALGNRERMYILAALHTGDHAALAQLADWYRDNVPGLIEE